MVDKNQRYLGSFHHRLKRAPIIKTTKSPSIEAAMRRLIVAIGEIVTAGAQLVPGREVASDWVADFSSLESGTWSWCAPHWLACQQSTFALRATVDILRQSAHFQLAVCGGPSRGSRGKVGLPSEARSAQCGERRMVDLKSASWNRIVEWIKRIEALEATA